MIDDDRVLELAALLVGFLIGTVGVGGVLLAPALILVGRVEPVPFGNSDAAREVRPCPPGSSCV